jgi:chromosome segregation ATPase
MSEDLSTQLCAARQKLDHAAQLEMQRREFEEILHQGRYRVETVEMQIEMVSEDIRKLEGASLSNLVWSMFGDKQAKIDGRKEMLATLNDEQGECRAAVETATQELAAVEKNIQDLGDIRAEYERLFSLKETNLSEESGGAVHTVDDKLSEVQALSRQIAKARDAGDSLVSRIGTARSAARSVSQRSARGVIVGTVVNSVMSQATKPSAEAMAGAHGRFIELLRDLMPSIASSDLCGRRQFCDGLDRYLKDAEVCLGISADQPAADQLEQSTSVCVCQLQDLIDHLSQHETSLVDQRRELIENA